MTENSKRRTLVALYLRVSTDQQDLELQRSQLIEECRRCDYEIYREYSDFITGTSESRKGLDQMLFDAKRGLFTKILIWKLDRLSRDVRVGLNLLHEIESTPSVEINFIQESFINTNRQNPAMAEMARNMILIGAGMELRSIRQRTRAAKTASILANKWPSSFVPIGYRKTAGQQLEIDTQTAPIVKRIFSMYLDQRLSIRDIKRQLELEKIPAFRSSQRWNKDGISKMLSNAVYIGKKLIAGKKLAVRHMFICEPIISEERFIAVQERKRSMSDTSGRKPNYEYPFRPYLFCAGCGHRLHGIQCGGSKQGKSYTYGQFHRPSDPSKFKRRCPEGCGRITERVLTRALLEYFLKNIAGQSVEQIKDSFSEGDRHKNDASDAELMAVYDGELQKLESRRLRVVDMYESDAIKKTDFNRRMLGVSAHESALLDKIRLLRQKSLKLAEYKEEDQVVDQIILGVKSKASRVAKLLERHTPADEAAHQRNHALYLDHVKDFLPLIESMHVDFRRRLIQVKTKRPQLLDGKLIFGPAPVIPRGRPPKSGGGNNSSQLSRSGN